MVLAGGAATRMGQEKTSLDVGGRSLLDRVVAAADGATRTIVVGDRRRTERPVIWCREEPPGGGPAAAVAAALAHVGAEVVVLLAGDQPFVDTAAVDALVAALADDGAVAVDAGGHPQWLCSAWRTQALAKAGLGAHTSMRRAVGALRWHPVPLEARVTLDCDTPDDLRRARELA